MSYKEGWRAYLAGELKQWIKIPVISGRVINNPGAARQLLKSNQADFVTALFYLLKACVDGSIDVKGDRYKAVA